MKGRVGPPTRCLHLRWRTCLRQFAVAAGGLLSPFWHGGGENDQNVFFRRRAACALRDGRMLEREISVRIANSENEEQAADA